MLDESGNSLLHWACFSGYYDIVVYLLEQGWYWRYDELRISTNPLQTGIDTEIANSTEHQTAIHWAVAGGRIRIVHLLHTHSPRLIHHVDARGYGLVHVAVQNCHLVVAHYLIVHGLSPHHRDNDGTIFTHNDLCQLTEIQQLQGNTPLHWACIKNDVNMLRYLISAGADVCTQGSKGMTSLHWTAALGTFRF